MFPAGLFKTAVTVELDTFADTVSVGRENRYRKVGIWAVFGWGDGVERDFGAYTIFQSLLGWFSAPFDYAQGGLEVMPCYRAESRR